ncbi:hypothetical protein GE061_005424 [Apolygus lucorum]|uniref:Major facilitator superfamily (MFS) profile domain-containing protein n=1 Tax=Apolygus lucorum TaxID=248454 RepID=A0A8S9WW84_APOLU|nr:hypothetical protein GE061_005424 [Apolygus lucorum]
MKIDKGGTQHKRLPAHGSTQQESQKYFPGIWNQYYATFSVCVAGFGLGASGGWASPMLLVLESEDSPVGPMTNLEISPLETLPAIAALFSTVIFATILTRFGRKAAGYLGAAVSIVGWLFLLSAKYKLQLYIGRFIVGLSTVGLAMIGPIYLSEVAYVSIRGSLMTYTGFAAHFGSLVSFIVGAICSYRLFTAICMIGPLLFPLTYFWIPESPQFLLLQSRNAEARNALLWYRGGDSSLVDAELESLSNVSKHRMTFRVVLKDRGNRRAILVFLFLFTFTTMAGTAVISGYASKIFQNADSALDPNTSAAVLASIKFISSLVAIQLIDRFGRKVLVIFSYFNFLVESLFAVSAIFISWYIVPETKGKTIAEISQILKGDVPHVSKKSHITRL